MFPEMTDLLSYLEPHPDVHIEEHEAQKTLLRFCPVCKAQQGVSCTVPVEVDFQTKRQQVLEFHQERVATAITQEAGSHV